MRERPTVGDVFDRDPHFLEGNRAVAVLTEQIE
jgi:hypothetical protein